MPAPRNWLLGLAVAIASAGCASTNAPEEESARLLREREARIADLEREVAAREARIETLSEQVESGLPAVSAAPSGMGTTRYNQIPGGDLLPPASPGECYARVFVPPAYETTTEQVLKSGATERIEIEPARYETVEEQVLVEAASERIEVIPAEYGWVEEKVLVKAASSRLEEVPAQYEWKEEQVLVKPAHTVWKKGEGPIQKVDSATGEIMCLVEVPAEYKTVRTRVQVAPATTREIAIPAEYKTVRKQVVTKPASTRTVEVPAKYNTVKVRRLVEPARERRIPIEAEYQTVSKRVQVTEGEMAWREILCKTNTTPDVVRRLQTALRSAGHNPGPIDGIVGQETLAALKGYQQEKGLATGGVTMATLQSLGVK
ncbi:MAG TPA: peptidoglycan-binding domain-containing protein [Myxococcota bacterium]|nr:peptidoglycan-binding domain-containing protein [Myxococcota bacterium]